MGRVCVFDTEGDGLLDEITQMFCAVFKDRDTGEVFKFNVTQADWPKNMLSFMNSCDVLCGHNCVQYDFPVYEKLFNYEFSGKKVDTLIMSRLHNPNRKLPEGCPTKIVGCKGQKPQTVGPHSVLAWGYRVGRGKVEHNDWTEYTEHMLHRCTEDVEVQSLIWDALIKEAEGQNWEPAYQLSNTLFDILRRQEEYGWLADKVHMKKSICLLTRIIEVIDAKVKPLLPYVLVIEEGGKKSSPNWVKKPFKKNGEYTKAVLDWMNRVGMDPEKRQVKGPFSRISFRYTNLNSRDEAVSFLLSAGWKPHEWNFSNGRRSSPKLSQSETFDGVKTRAGKLVAKRIVARHRRSQIEGWLRNLRPDGRIACRITGLATTGRAKHSGIVNVPSFGKFFGMQMRKCFICKPGYKIVGTDAAGCQDRMLAHHVGDDDFTYALIHGDKAKETDMHNVNKKAINKALAEKFPDKHIEVSRKVAKNINFGTKFGGGDKKIGSMVGEDDKVGAVIKEAVFGVAPGFKTLIERLNAEWKKTAKPKRSKFGGFQLANGYITGLDGRPVLVESPHMLLVYLLQSDEAIMMSAAYCYLDKWCKERGWIYGEDYGFLAWVHE